MGQNIIQAALASIDAGTEMLASVAGIPTPQEARVQILANGLQESGLVTRVQFGDGPAHGLFQFEINGCRAVLSNPKSRPALLAYWRESNLERASVDPTAEVLWEAIEDDDRLAAVLARLLLWCDEHPLAALGRVWDAWRCYVRTWCPGAPRPDDWPANYGAALEAVTSHPAPVVIT